MGYDITLANFTIARAPVVRQYRRTASLRLRFVARGMEGMADLMQACRVVYAQALDDIDIHYYGCRQDHLD